VSADRSSAPRVGIGGIEPVDSTFTRSAQILRAYPPGVVTRSPEVLWNCPLEELA
jgi:hypothetical protein